MVVLSVLDQVPIALGEDAGAAIAHSVELARAAEDFGYGAYWFAEHHLDEGRASSSPAILIALAAQATRHIRLGSAATVLPFHSGLEIAEQFGTLDAIAPGRVTLGLGRGKGYASADPHPALGRVLRRLADEPDATAADLEVPAGGGDYLFELLGHLLGTPLPVPDDRARVHEILNLLQRPVASVDGVGYTLSPGYLSGLGLAVFGGASGSSADLAADLGLPLYVNSHSIPNKIVDTVARYRERFVPSKVLDSPYVGVSAHAIAASSARRASELEETFLRTLSSLITRGTYQRSAPPSGTPFDDPGDEHFDAEKFREARELSISGEAGAVVDRLRALTDSIGADELLVTTIVHSASDRRDSYRLIAEHWDAGAG